jgi:hypothetical protein
VVKLFVFAPLLGPFSSQSVRNSNILENPVARFEKIANLCGPTQEVGRRKRAR